MTTRVLPPEEWPRLVDTIAASIWQRLDPQWCEVVVTEDAGVIVACLILYTAVHVECAMNTGHAGALRGLLRTARARLDAMGSSGSVWAASADAEMHAILSKHATPLPGSHFIWSVPGGSVCRPS